MAKILIVEDDELMCECLDQIISDWGHTTVTAHDVDEALALLGSPRPLDLMKTDIRLKTAMLGGYDLAQLARRDRPALHVLYATGDSMTAAHAAMFVGGATHIHKPYKEAQLRAALDDLLGTTV